METRNCEECGQPFAPRREHARFCSARCRVTWNRASADGLRPVRGNPPTGPSLSEQEALAYLDLARIHVKQAAREAAAGNWGAPPGQVTRRLDELEGVLGELTHAVTRNGRRP